MLLATASMPIVSAPPGRFSTTTGWPSGRAISGASNRARLSVALPAACGTMSLSGFSGYPASAAAATPRRSPSASARAGVLALERAKDLPDDVAAGLDRVLADLLFFLGDHVEQPVERLLRHVVVEIGLVFLDEAELHALAGVLVVLLGELHPGGGALDDRQELAAQRVGGRALEVFGAGGLAAGEDAFRILHRHLLHRVDEELLRLGHGLLGCAVHGEH